MPSNSQQTRQNSFWPNPRINGSLAQTAREVTVTAPNLSLCEVIVTAPNLSRSDILQKPWVLTQGNRRTKNRVAERQSVFNHHQRRREFIHRIESNANKRHIVAPRHVYFRCRFIGLKPNAITECRSATARLIRNRCSVAIRAAPYVAPTCRDPNLSRSDNPCSTIINGDVNSLIEFNQMTINVT